MQNDRVPDNIWQMHVFVDELILGRGVGLRRDHVAHGLVECVHLVRLQIANNRVYVVQDLLDEWYILAELNLNKVAATLLRYLDERVTGHVLHTLVCFYINRQKVVRILLNVEGMIYVKK